MDALYSFSLGAAMLASAVSVRLAVTRRKNAALWCAAASLVLVLVATATHVAFGHRPGSAAALGLTSFVVEHPSLAAVGAISLMLLVWTSATR